MGGLLCGLQLELGFRQLDGAGVPLRRSRAEVAALLHLPEER